MKRPTPLFGATPEQAEHFLTLYRSAPLRAAAAEAGLNIIQATMIARHSGCLRITEAAIVNSKHGEIGRMGEEIFQQHFPEAVNCNTSVAQNNPAYDFVLNGMRIDIKTSCLSASGREKIEKSDFAATTNSIQIYSSSLSNKIAQPPCTTTQPTATVSLFPV